MILHHADSRETEITWSSSWKVKIWKKGVYVCVPSNWRSAVSKQNPTRYRGRSVGGVTHMLILPFEFFSPTTLPPCVSLLVASPWPLPLPLSFSPSISSTSCTCVSVTSHSIKPLIHLSCSRFWNFISTCDHVNSSSFNLKRERAIWEVNGIKIHFMFNEKLIYRPYII